MKSTRNGALFASAAAMMFIAGTAIAQGTSSMSGPGAMSAQTAKVKCVGANDCKGHGACKSAQNDCKGQNSCKGKGFIHTSSTNRYCVRLTGRGMGSRTAVSTTIFNMVVGARVAVCS